MLGKRIIWADDEIDLLTPHILYLEKRGYQVTSVTNGQDAISYIMQEKFDAVLLDEMMDGKDGLTTLQEIKELDPSLPVIMITKSEEEQLMDDAIGRKIDYYLTKPVNPSQIVLAFKKILESSEIAKRRISKGYIQEFNQITEKLMTDLVPEDWYDIQASLADWEIELDQHKETGLRQTLHDQIKECNKSFGKFVEKNYKDWVQGNSSSRPDLSTDIIKKYVFPKVAQKRHVVLFVIDCLRLDQWLGFETELQSYFNINRNYCYSILPTATPYSRNAIFSGMFPSEFSKKWPGIWSKASETEDETSQNRFEKELLDFQLQSNHVPLQNETRYVKVLNISEAKQLEHNIISYVQSCPLLAVVVNFLDILAHSRCDSAVLKEIAPNESAYRSLSNSWFVHSPLFNTLRLLAKQDVDVIITSDHGSIRSLHGTKVIGDKQTSTSLRYKYGRGLKVSPKHAMVIKNPEEYRLPTHGLNTNYIIAKEDFYFVYPTNYHYYLNYYNDSFQHGGISMEEVLMPVIELTPRKT